LFDNQCNILILYFPSQIWLGAEDLGNQVLSLSGRFLEKIF